MATPGQGAQVIEGEMKQALLNGDTANYDMERGFTRHPIEDRTDGIVIQLGKYFFFEVPPLPPSNGTYNWKTERSVK